MIYYIGGSPCSGKSTISKLLEKKYGFYYFELDERLGDYMEKAKLQGKIYSSKYFTKTTDQIWLRDPHVLKYEEFEFYKEIFEYAFEELNNLPKNIDIITEGAGYLPELMKKIDVSPNEYVCIVPTKEFQYEYYSKRTWVPTILEKCSDKKLAFSNWMERDALFAVDVLNSAKQLNYASILVDGSIGIEENLSVVEKILGLI